MFENLVILPSYIRRIVCCSVPTRNLRCHFCQLFPSLSLISFGLLRRSLAVSILTSGSRPPFSCFSKPNTWPTNPPGFGTGHSLLLSGIISACTCSEPVSPSTNFRLLLLRLSSSGTSPSANARRGTGHGRRCGRLTTRKETARVPVNMDIVARERGWRCDGIAKGRLDGWARSRCYCGFIWGTLLRVKLNTHVSKSVEHIRELTRHTTVGN